MSLNSNLNWNLGRRVEGAFPTAYLATYHKTITDNVFAESKKNFSAKFLPRIADFNGTDDFINCGNDSSIQNIFDGGGAVLATVNLRTGGQNSIGNIVNKETGWYIYTGVETATGVRLRLYAQFSNTDGVWETTSEEITFGVEYKISIRYDNSSVNNDPIFSINGIEKTVGSGITELLTPVGTRVTDVGTDLVIGNRAALNRAADGLISDVRLYSREITTQESSDYNDGVELSTADLQASYRPTGQGGYEYDLSGNNNHGTWSGTGSRYDYDINGSTYPNQNGYSLWEHATSDPIQVPFDINGLPLSLTVGVNIPAGYTKTRDVVAGGDKWNMADALVGFNETGAADTELEIFDRSNATRQTVASRASIYYDTTSLATRCRYNVKEIADPRFYDTFFETDYQDRVFGKVLLDNGDVVRLDEYLTYSVKQTNKLPTILKYCKITDIYP